MDVPPYHRELRWFAAEPNNVLSHEAFIAPSNTQSRPDSWWTAMRPVRITRGRSSFSGNHGRERRCQKTLKRKKVIVEEKEEEKEKEKSM